MATKSSVKNKSTLTGTNAADVLTVKHSEVTVKAGKGNDKITVSKGAGNVLYGGAGADTITIGKSAGIGNMVYGDAGNDTVKVSTKFGVTINGGAGNDTFTGGKGNDTFTGGKGKDTFFYANGGGKDTITDYQPGQDTLQITSGSISKTAIAKNKKDLVFTVGKGTITLKNAAGKKISMKDTRGTYTTNSKLITLGKDFTGTMDATKYVSTIKSIDARNVAKVVNITGNSQANKILPGRGGGTYKCGAGDDTITIRGSAKYTVYGDAGDDHININGVGTGNTVYGNDGNDTIYVTSGKNVIYGGAGADTIKIGGGASHIISGGAGNDTFNHTSGTETIKDYAAGDTLSFTSAITGVTVSGQNIILTAGTGGSVTVENGVGKLTQVTEADKKKNVYVIAAGTPKFTGSGADDIIVINNNSGSSTTAFGGAGNDRIYSGAGSDVLYGGAGNDTLRGGTGKDTFVYANGEGNDTVTDYTEGEDTLRISSGSISKAALANSNKDVVFTVGNGSITLQNAVAKSISLKDSRGRYAVSNTAIELGSDFLGTMDANAYLSTVKTINGRNATNLVNITGNAQNNIIYVSKAGGKVNGGAGNDTIHIDGAAIHIISGGAGNDTFHHTSGTATIKDYGAGDSLFLADCDYKFSVDGQNITLDGADRGRVTVENGVGKLTQFHNGDRETSILYAKGDISFGTDDGDIIIANSTDNTQISAQGGDDILYGGYWQNGDTGNDQLFSGSSTQHMFGGGDSDKDVFYFSSDSYKGEISIYNFNMCDDMIEFMDEGEHSVYADSDPWRDGSDVCLKLSNGSNLRFVDYADDMIYYADVHNSMYGAMAVDG